MRLLTFGLRPALIASAVAAVLLVVVLPATYDSLGEGPELVKSTVKASPRVAQVCGKVNHFFIIPWRLSLEDTDRHGELEVSYWVACGSGISRIDAALFHSGGAWQVKSIGLATDGGPGPCGQCGNKSVRLRQEW